MLATKLEVFRYAFISFAFALICVAFLSLNVSSQTPARGEVDYEKEMELLKEQMEQPGSSPMLVKRYNRLAGLFSNCNPAGMLIDSNKENIGNPFAPAASLCINGSLAVADPDFNRPLAISTGTGIGNGTVGNCSLSGSGTAVNYDNFSFNLAGCASFPTEVTATLCGPLGCQHIGNVDTFLALYRNVPAGDPLTANGGLPAVFNPAAPCTNARGGQDDLGTTAGTTNNPGGSTCNQVVGANCVAPCTTPSNAGGLSGFRRHLGNGRFTLVVGGFGNATVGNYNLYVDAPAAGCTLALAPTAAGVGLSGRIRNTTGRGIRNVAVTISGDAISAPRTVLSSSFGYYNFENLPAGETYIVSVGARRFTFNPSNQAVTLNDSVSDADFFSEQ